MPSYTIVENINFKPITTTVKACIENDYFIEHKFKFAMLPITASSSLVITSGTDIPVNVDSFDIYTLKLHFNNDIVSAKFELNGDIINEMLVNENYFSYYINPSFLKEGVNTLSIYTEDSGGTVSRKTLELDKTLIPNTLAINDLLHIKGKRYKVLSVNGDIATLDKVLATDVKETSLVENPTGMITPFVDVTFYNESPDYKPMEFVKSIFIDGSIEDEYELSNVAGDLLHARIDINRNNANEEVSISNVEYMLLPDEV